MTPTEKPRDPGAAPEFASWVIVGPQGLAYVGLHKSEADAWCIYLGWPSQEEIDNAIRSGWYAAKAQITWSKP